MALDDLVRIGKKATAGEKSRDSYDKDSKKNLALDLAKLQYADQPNGQLLIDTVKNDSTRGPGYGATKHGESYNDFISGKREGAYVEVEADITGSFAAVGDDRLVPYLMNRTPLQYSGTDQEVLDAHAAAYAATQLKKDDAAKKKRAKETFKKIVADLKASNPDTGMLKFVQSIAEATGYEETMKLYVDAEIEAAIKAFGQIDPVKLRGYAQARYEGIQDQGARKAEAYELAKAVGESN